MISDPPIASELKLVEHPRTKEQVATWGKPWATWFTQVWLAIAGWTHTFFASLTHDFGSINAQSQATTTVTVTGAAVGDAVLVRPTTAVNGILLDGTVTAANTVTVRAVNYSAAPIDPASQVYSVIVFQQ
jgi:hypothetical protein